jgi:hypothetical protein
MQVAVEVLSRLDAAARNALLAHVATRLPDSLTQLLYLVSQARTSPVGYWLRRALSVSTLPVCCRRCLSFRSVIAFATAAASLDAAAAAAAAAFEAAAESLTRTWGHRELILVHPGRRPLLSAGKTSPRCPSGSALPATLLCPSLLQAMDPMVPPAADAMLVCLNLITAVDGTACAT